MAGLAVPDPDDIGLADWAETLDGPHPAARALRDAAAGAQLALARTRAAVEAELTQARAMLAELNDERVSLESGVVSRPPVPYTRGEGARDGAAGAALWQVTDFRPGLSEFERAGLEAAMEASGLLDAWLTADGRLRNADTHDVIALPGAPVTRRLGELLVPAIDESDPHARAIPADVIARVLAAVSCAELPDGPYVTSDGRWRLGPLRGAWAKEHAAYIGHGARAAARQRRLAELRALIAEASERRSAAEAAVAACAARQVALGELLESAPTDDELRAAHATVASAAEAVDAAHTAVDAARTDVDWAERDLAEAVSNRDLAAADTGCPATVAGLRDVAGAVGQFRQAATEFAGALKLHTACLVALATWTQELAAAQSESLRLQDVARAAAVGAASERQRAETLRGSIGASVQETKDRLAGVRARIAQLERLRKDAAEDHVTAIRTRAEAEGEAKRLGETLAAALERRDHAVAELQRFAATGLLREACEGEELESAAGSWAADPAVRLARRIEQVLSDVDDGDEAWERIRAEITSRFSELNEGLTRYGHQAVASMIDWFVVTITFQGSVRTPTELAALLAEEISYRERVLTEQQRRVIENHLINDVASHLQQLISDAETQVAHMNSELRDRPTSTGMMLRLRWEVRLDGPAGLAQARSRLLRQDYELWSPADREAVGDFLNRQIEAARAEDEHATWAELLGRALDYRHWHRFLIDRQQDGQWRSATGPASGGERVLTVSVPLFAAASAHYRSAHAHAPRLIMLDEAFAGVDDSARGQFLGLLAAFDLDVAMTSEREWGFYPSVPGIATHQLVRRDGIDAVHVTTWEWDGNAPRRVERPPRARVPAQVPRPAAGTADAMELPGAGEW